MKQEKPKTALAPLLVERHQRDVGRDMVRVILVKEIPAVVDRRRARQRLRPFQGCFRRRRQEIESRRAIRHRLRLRLGLRLLRRHSRAQLIGVTVRSRAVHAPHTVYHARSSWVRADHLFQDQTQIMQISRAPN
eukprot:COSAG05_NODE_6_length_45604_cov_26.489660_21_plen_134_part_00